MKVKKLILFTLLIILIKLINELAFYLEGSEPRSIMTELELNKVPFQQDVRFHIDYINDVRLAHGDNDEIKSWYQIKYTNYGELWWTQGSIISSYSLKEKAWQRYGVRTKYPAAANWYPRRKCVPPIENVYVYEKHIQNKKTLKNLICM